MNIYIIYTTITQWKERRMGKRRNIYVSNIKVQELLEKSENASRLIEEAIIFYDYAYKNGYLYDREYNRVDVQKLLAVSAD